jgi:phosphatidylserine/phosphatidylglycerophosphate/cardiolipin synthase-like enzyme
LNDVVVYAGCRIFEVRVSVGAGTSMSPLEQHVLKAVHAGVDTVSGLCDVLGITSRLMVDLLGDLWRSEHVSFDFLDERVSITEQVRRLVAEDALDTLPGAEISDEQREMMLDTLSGLLTPVGGLRRAPDRNLELPEHEGEAQLSGIGQAALAEALTRILNEDGQLAGSTSSGGRPKRVVRAYLSPESLTAPSARRRYRPVGIRVALDSDGQLVARLAEDALPGRYQEAAQARLTMLIEDQPASSFVRALRAAAGGPPQEPATLASALSELAEQAAALGAAPPETRERDHNQMAVDSRRIVRRLQGLAEQEAGVTLLSGHAAHAAAIERLIRGARTQVVLACPWVSYGGLATYADALEDAVRRGVQIVLLWGIGREDVPEGAINNALSALQRQTAPGAGAGMRVLISPQASSVIHAKLVIGDDRQAVVSSLNFLDPSRPGTHELGVQVNATAGRRSPAIEEMLAWARGAMPDYTVAQSVITDAASFPIASGEPDPEPDPVPDVAADPPLTALASADPVDGPAVAAWAAAWRRRVEELAAASRRRRASVRLIRDGEHRDLLWTALRTARRHLLITSDGLAEDVVDQAFVDHVEQCLQRGVDVALVYRRARRETGAQAVQRLQALADRPATSSGRLRVTNQNNHAKVLVVDDEAVVTSFNFLSFEGYYGGVGRRRQRSEVGVRIFGGGFADRLLESFGVTVDHLPTADDSGAGLPAHPAVEQLRALPVRALSAAQQLLDRLHGDGHPVTGKELAELTGSGAEALAVLAALRACGATQDLLELVVAAVLGQIDHQVGGTGRHPEIDGWWAWLSRSRFEDGDFIVAAALRAAVPGTDARPRQALIDVAARRGTPELGAALSDAVLRDDLSPAEWHALFAVGVHELLQTGGTDFAGAVGIAAAAVNPLWAELGTIALRWWDEAQRPLPIDRIQRGEQQRQMAAGAADQWATLDGQLRAFERYSTPFTVGSGTRRFLLRTGGPLNLLTMAAQNRDRAAVRTWMEDPKLRNVGGWVDAATRAAGITKLIHGHLRPPFVDRIESIVTAARTVAEHEDVGAAPPEPFDETMDAARACVRELRAALPRLGSAAASVDLPERALAEAALRDLKRLSGEGAP